MTEKQADLRVIRTKKLIEEALLALIEEKGFENVTVRDLTKKAGINRGTFYLHYRDIYDLMEKLETEMMKGLFKIPRSKNVREILNHDSEQEPIAPIMEVFIYLQENARFFKVMFDPKGSTTFGERMKLLIRTHMYAQVERVLIVPDDLSVPPDYYIAYMSAAHFGIIQYWFETGMALSPREVALMLTRLVQKGTF